MQSLSSEMGRVWDQDRGSKMNPEAGPEGHKATREKERCEKVFIVRMAAD